MSKATLTTMITAMKSGRFNGKLCAAEQARLIDKWEKQLANDNENNEPLLFDKSSKTVIL